MTDEDRARCWNIRTVIRRSRTGNPGNHIHVTADRHLLFLNAAAHKRLHAKQRRRRGKGDRRAAAP